ncbi:GIY-YIG nuclease family protein [Kistimonas asteriae]|uniref:GIY-YIG nuclease family protein n=1 Tax=Kistimonas asteriae TaxID=517724 RepID=UPI001BAA492D|nr:GIY-YIG nuclease family protein [Kistimonas asteriae]
MHPASIRLFLANGSPTGLRTAELSNWNGKGVTCPRSEFRDFLAREELEQPGIYLLTGVDPETDEPAIYIGEAEHLRKRLATGHKHVNQDFWNTITIFISQNDYMTKAHVKYIEGRLIVMARATGRAKLENSVSSGAKLSEADTAEMESFIEYMMQLLPVLGVTHFTPVRQPARKQAGTVERAEDTTLYYRIKQLTATGQRTEQGFVVYSGSEAVYELKPSCSNGIRELREKLIGNGVLKKTDSGYVFTADHEFGSPSTAGAIICGGSTNGLTAWKNASGVTLKALESED